MKNLPVRKLTLKKTLIRVFTAVIALNFAITASAQDEIAIDGMGNMSADPFSFNTPEVALYKQRCAQCHDNATGRVPPRGILRYQPAQTVYQAMAAGVMAPMAAGLSDEQMRSLTKLLTGKEPQAIPDPNEELCAAGAAQPQAKPGDWLSTHGGIKSRRYRDSSVFKASTLDKLTLEWAYAIPGGAKGPVTVAGNTLYLAGTAHVVALDKATGCVRWAHAVGGRTVRAVTIADAKQASAASIAVFGDDANDVVALDAATGKELWRVNVETNVLGRITAAPTVHDGVVYVPISSMEDPLTHDVGHFCCSARGGLAAIDLSTGKQLWKQHHITAPLAPIKAGQPEDDHAGAQAHSTEQFDQGPAGASTYTPLTIDEKRGLVYASTAEEYAFTGAPGPYSLLAYDLKTGKRAWQQSLLPPEAERSRICATKETDCRNLFSTGTSVLIHSLADDKEILVLGQKSGMVHGLDPDDGGRIVWSSQVSEGGDLGGVMYGLAADSNTIYVPIADVDSPSGRFTGSLVALDPATGIVAWRSETPKANCNWTKKNCIGGQVAAATVISDMVFTGSWDGHVRIYSTLDGRLLGEIDTAKEYPAVNGRASGGQVSGYPVTVDEHAIYITSGASSIMKSGNALLKYRLNAKQ